MWNFHHQLFHVRVILKVHLGPVSRSYEEAQDRGTTRTTVQWLRTYRGSIIAAFPRRNALTLVKSGRLVGRFSAVRRQPVAKLHGKSTNARPLTTLVLHSGYSHCFGTLMRVFQLWFVKIHSLNLSLNYFCEDFIH